MTVRTEEMVMVVSERLEGRREKNVAELAVMNGNSESSPEPCLFFSLKARNSLVFRVIEKQEGETVGRGWRRESERAVYVR